MASLRRSKRQDLASGSTSRTIRAGLTSFVFFILLAVQHQQHAFLANQSRLTERDYDLLFNSTATYIVNKEESSPKSDESLPLKLRFDWTSLTVESPLAQRMVEHQFNCEAPMGTFLYRNRFGLGSDLHIWGQALCNGMQLGLRLRTVGNWTWMDQNECGGMPSPMLCYFQEAELNCPNDQQIAYMNPGFDANQNLSRSNGIVNDLCQDIYQGMPRTQVRISALEYLFTRVTPRLQQEAERQLNLVFAGLQEVPKDLITVHIRWGDKKREMKLVEIGDYIEAVHKILRARSISTLQDETQHANIYLATEDPEAVRQFQAAMPESWNLFVDHAFVELLPHRVEEYNGSPKMSRLLHGRAGLVALGSLLVAMEANEFVLTTASNWSRLMNELRLGILNHRCQNCTSMIDLRRVRNEF